MEALLDAYPILLDRGRVCDVADLFMPDGVVEGPVGAPGIGRAGIERFLRLAASRVTVPPLPKLMRHHLTSRHIVVGDGEATARSYFLALTELGLDHWGSYDDRIVRHQGSWLIARKILRIDGWNRGSWWERNQAGEEE